MHVAIESEAPRRMTDEQRRLAMEYHEYAMQIAKHASKKYRAKYRADDGDIASAAQFGLCDAAMRFDPERGLKFATYARHRITGAILDMLRDASEHTRRERAREKEGEFVPRAISMDAAHSRYREDQTSGGRAMKSLHDRIIDEDADPEEIERDIDFRRRLDLIAERMGRRGQMAAEYFGTEATMKQIGKRYFVCESRVSQSITQVIAAIREAPQSFGF